MKKILITLITIAAISCGTRKVEESKTEVKKESKIEKETHESANGNVTVQTNTETDKAIEMDEFEMKPIDSTSPIELTDEKGNVTKIKNATVRAKKTKDNTKTVEASKTAENWQVLTTGRENSQSSEWDLKTERTSDRKGYDWTTTIIIVVIVIVAALLFYFGAFRRKSRSDTPEV